MTNTQQNTNDPMNLIGMELQAATGLDNGIRIVSFDAGEKRYIVLSIRWSSRELIDVSVRKLAPFKISYRYNMSTKRPAP